MTGPSGPTGATRLAAVIGDPVRHSLSPVIHNAAFAATGLDWVYVALPVRAGHGAAAVAAMATMGIEGLSVTMPHKADVAAAVAKRTPAAEALGSCNTVFWDDTVLVGDTTDGDGFVRSLVVDEALAPAGARVVIVGTGGSASAIVEALGRAGAADVGIVSRSAARAEHCARLASVAHPAGQHDVATADIVVNASPVGMAGGPDPDGTPIEVDAISDHQAIVDIVYAPRETPLLAAAAARGARSINGVGMLLHQAALQFERWTDTPAPLDAMRAAAFD